MCKAKAVRWGTRTGARAARTQCPCGCARTAAERSTAPHAQLLAWRVTALLQGSEDLHTSSRSFCGSGLSSFAPRALFRSIAEDHANNVPYSSLNKNVCNILIETHRVEGTEVPVGEEKVDQDGVCVCVCVVP